MNRNKPKQVLFWLCFGLFCETKNQKIWFVSVCFSVFNLYRNIRNKQNCFETNRNNPKFSEKYLNMLSFKLLVFCLFRFNRNIETLCFGIEAKNRNKLFRNKKKKPKKRKTLNFLKEIPNYALKLLRLVFCLFRFNRNVETLGFDIEAKQLKQTFCFG